MSASVRSYLVAGAAAATATAIALAPVQATPADIAVPAHPTTTQPQLSQAMVDLLAAASRMTAAVTPKTPSLTGTEPALGVAPSAAVTGDVAVQNAASDWLTWAYEAIQYWVDYGVDFAEYVLGWVPGGWLIGDQVDIFYYDLIRPIANSVVYNLIDPVLNAPLNLGVWATGIGDVAWSVAAGLINTGIAEVNYFLGWILPPLPPLPFPPLPPLPTAAQAMSAPLATPSLRDVIGSVVLPPAGFVTDTLTGANSLLLATSQNLTEGVIGAVEPVLDHLGLGLINRQINLNYELLSRLSTEQVGFVNDMIRVPEAYLTDVLRDGAGPIRALGTQAQSVVNSVIDHGTASVDAVGDYVRDQIHTFTPGLATTDTDKPASVPTSVRASLQGTDDSPTDTTSAADTTEKPATTGTKRGGLSPTLVKAKVSEPQTRVQSRLGSTAAAAETGVKSGTPKAAQKKAGEKKSPSRAKKTSKKD